MDEKEAAYAQCVEEWQRSGTETGAAVGSGAGVVGGLLSGPFSPLFATAMAGIGFGAGVAAGGLIGREYGKYVCDGEKSQSHTRLGELSPDTAAHAIKTKPLAAGRT